MCLNLNSNWSTVYSEQFKLEEAEKLKQAGNVKAESRTNLVLPILWETAKTNKFCKAQQSMCPI